MTPPANRVSSTTWDRIDGRMLIQPSEKVVAIQLLRNIGFTDEADALEAATREYMSKVRAIRHAAIAHIEAVNRGE